MKIKLITDGDPLGISDHSYVNIDEDGVEFAIQFRASGDLTTPMRKRRIAYMTWGTFDAIVEVGEGVRDG